jgi:hypothetical protein
MEIDWPLLIECVIVIAVMTLCLRCLRLALGKLFGSAGAVHRIKAKSQREILDSLSAFAPEPSEAAEGSTFPVESAPEWPAISFRSNT